jgi:hypothetical protein
MNNFFIDEEKIVYTFLTGESAVGRLNCQQCDLFDQCNVLPKDFKKQCEARSDIYWKKISKKAMSFERFLETLEF